MKLQNSFFITRKENPSNDEYIASQLLIRSGMLYKNGEGIYTYTPIGKKILDNLIRIIKEEHEKNNANEVLMPSLVNEEVFKRSSRDKLFGNSMFNIKDTDDNVFSLCPTHEELFACLADQIILSYKDLHFTLFQISNKYRNEIDTNINRRKEFMMCDAYSFDADDSGMDISYDTMYHVYKKIFDRFCIKTVTALSYPGKMQGILSEEFQCESEKGEDTIIKCKKCSFVANSDIAQIKRQDYFSNEKNKKYLKVFTPNVSKVDELATFLGIRKDTIIKSMIFKVNDKYKMVLVRGTDEININKLCLLYNTDNIRLATENEIITLGSIPGYVGPIKATMEIIADNYIKTLVNGVCGSNIKDYHYVNATPGVDFKVDRYEDIKIFSKNDLCPRCGSKVDFLKTIEIANIFKLGTIYSDAFSLKYSNEKNEYNRVYMGSYGIGIERCLNMIVEQHHDSKGIVWPMEVSPFKVCIVIVNVNDKISVKYANDLYEKLNKMKIDTLLDNRKESVGSKFIDMDLIGIPIRITVGFKINEGIVEIKEREEKEGKEIKTDNLIKEISKIIENCIK